MRMNDYNSLEEFIGEYSGIRNKKIRYCLWS